MATRSKFKDEILELHHKGYSDKEIAAIAYCSIHTVRKYVPRCHQTIYDTTRPTKAELEILQLLAQGMSSEKAAKARFCSRRTIESHISNLYQKAYVSNRTLLIAWGVQHGYCQHLQIEPALNLQNEQEPNSFDGDSFAGPQNSFAESAIAVISQMLEDEFAIITDTFEALLSNRLEAVRLKVKDRLEILIGLERDRQILQTHD